MKARYIFLSLLGAACLSSCSKLLDIPQHGVIPIDEFYQTDDQVLSANAEEYNMFRALPNGSGAMGLSFYGSMEWAWIQNKEAATDNTWSGGGSRGDNVDGRQISEWNLDSNTPNISIYYTLLFGQVYRANLVLDRAPEGQSDIIDMCRAEARVFRAFAYFELTTLWGTPPLVDHCLTAEEYKVTNSTQEELWKFMEDDLLTAINSGKLTEKTGVNDRTTWRITKQYAQALRGKVYLWQKKYDESAKVLDEIVKSGKYKLFTEGEYGDMFNPEWNFNCESMFQTNRVPDQNTSQGWRYLANYFNFRGGMVNWSPKATAYFETGGWGICIPTQNLYDAFVAWEGKDGYRLNQTMRSYTQLQEEFDFRLNTGVQMEGDSVWMWKTRAIKEHRMGMSRYNGKNWTIFRYAEVLLTAAESHLMNGNVAKATEYVNLIRERARLAPLASVTLDDIKMEKRLELCYEGSRLQDLQRWGDAATVLGNKGYDVPQFTVSYDPNHEDDYRYDTETIIHNHYYSNPSEYGYKVGKHEYWPFPRTEINANPNIKQNPGY